MKDDNVVQFRPATTTSYVPDGNLSCSCGDEWWTGGGVVFCRDKGRVVGHTIGDWRCASCGEAIPRA